MYYRLILFVLCFNCTTYCCAQQMALKQNKQHQQTRFAQYKSAKQKQFDAYRKKINDEYAAYMQHTWTEFKSFAAKSKPQSQDPPRPTIKTDNTPTPTNEISYRLVITLVPYEVPDPVAPIDEAPIEDKPSFNFNFHNTPCSVHLSNALKYSIADASEQSASQAWAHLSEGVYDALVADCLRMRNDMNLGDWGYIKFLQAMTQGFFGSNSNEAILMQMYVLSQSGYNVRIARTDDKWVLLVPFEEDIYNYSYITKDDTNFYILDKVEGRRSYFVFDKAFPHAHVPSLRMQKTPQLTFNPAPQRTLTSTRFPEMRVTVTENKNLMSFYNDYPLSGKWNYYSSTSLSEESKSSLYPVLKRQIAGKSQYDAANMLINFVQTAFKYQSDGQQFGYERPLFGDETLYYPYSDCEDRSILYSILVRELLGLDVVLLNYPGHIATAVRFSNDVAYGYHFYWDGKIFTICDPTYINAEVGDCMPDFRTTSPEVIQIQ